MATVIKTTFKLRRGLSAEWAEVNPILAQGEPGFALDTNLLKIGNGQTPWNSLEPINETATVESGVFSAETKKDFPTIGNENIIYKANSEKQIYQWNSTTQEYESFINADLSEEIKAIYQYKKFEIGNIPNGTLVDYKESEIRVMCPVDTEWKVQNVGPSGNANMYYMSFKAYAPENAITFKEGDRGVIVDETFDFNGPFSGIDEYGRKYSICWLALALNNNGDWTYFGKNSTVSKYIGWDYVVEWYDAHNDIISRDAIRINLSNEECHYVNLPYYMNSIDINTITQKQGDTLILYGGSATENV